MKKMFFVLLIFSSTANGQLTSIIMHGDTIFNKNPSTGDSVQMNHLMNTDLSSLSTLYQSKSIFGYTTGAGGTVSQSGTKLTGVTINKATGTITMVNSALAAAAEAKFTVTNSTVAATDIPIVVIKSGGTSGGYVVSVTAVAAGSFDITISNVSTGSLSEAVVLSFAIIKGSAN